MQRHFDEELTVLGQEILKMGGLVEEALGKSMKALVERDAALARSVVGSDGPINLLEVEIDEKCVELIALHQPAGSDIRMITMAMKINNDLERMGDHAVNIAERTLELLKEPLLKPLIDVPRMAQLAQEMVNDALDAFVRRDATLAKNVCKRDDQVDSLNDQVFRELLTYMMEDPKTIHRAVDLVLIARQLERIGDLATNVAEDIIYLVEGRTIKHHFEEEVQR
jgi:phosphate transport system protein